MGIDRTLLYKAHVYEPLYLLTESCDVSDGIEDKQPSFMQEYKFKLEKLYVKFYTKRASTLAAKRKTAAENLYQSLLAEIKECYSVQRLDK